VGLSVDPPSLGTVDPLPTAASSARDEPSIAWEPAERPEPAIPLVLEQSMAIDLVAKKADLPERSDPPRAPERAEPAEGIHSAESTQAPDRLESPGSSDEASPSEDSMPFSERSLAAAGVPRRRRWVWLVLLALLAGAAGGVYAFRSRIPWQRLRSFVGQHLGRQ
jgi:hypothetical protein